MPLSDTHLVLLSAASQRDDALLPRPDKIAGMALQRVEAFLIRAEVAEAVPVRSDQPHWSSDDAGLVGLRITPAGLAAIGIEAALTETRSPLPEPDRLIIGAAPSSPDETCVAKEPRPGTKLALIVALLSQAEGASIEALMSATGWQPHTVRAALTRLRQSGRPLVKAKTAEGRPPTASHLRKDRGHPAGSRQGRLMLPALSAGADDATARALRAEVESLQCLDLHDLRTRWRQRLRSTPPARLTRPLLMRLLAYKLQARVYGDLDPVTARYLDRVARDHAKRRDSAQKLKPKAVPPIPPVPRDRGLKPGTLLVREHAGTLHRVVIMAEGFGWEGRTYTSLSEIARLITGTRWSGPRFFGLRSKGSASGQENAT